MLNHPFRLYESITINITGLNLCLNFSNYSLILLPCTFGIMFFLGGGGVGEGRQRPEFKSPKGNFIYMYT